MKDTARVPDESSVETGFALVAAAPYIRKRQDSASLVSLWRFSSHVAPQIQSVFERDWKVFDVVRVFSADFCPFFSYQKLRNRRWDPLMLLRNIRVGNVRAM